MSVSPRRFPTLMVMPITEKHGRFPIQVAPLTPTAGSYTGGDTYFAGYDASEGHWDANLGMVYLTNPNPGVTGIMGFYGASTTPADHYYEDAYSYVGEALIAGQLPDTIDPVYQDAGYGLQWNRETLAPGQTWTIISYEKWTEAGFVQVFAPAEQSGNPGDVINYQFVVANYQSTADTFDLVLNSSNGWETSLPGGNTVNVPAGGSVPVDATVTIPAGAAPGTTDTLTLTATSQTDEDVTNEDSVTTQVLGEILDELVKLQGGGNCFIATAAYGSYQEHHVWILRLFRDQYLLTNQPGKAFVRFYYRHSPVLANIIARYDWLRAVTRIALLPVYGMACLVLNGWLGLAGLLTGLGLACLIPGLRRRLFGARIFLVLGLLFCFSRPCLALDANHFCPAIGEDVFVLLPTSSTLRPSGVSLDLFLSYANRPVEGLIGGTWRALSEHQTVANFGLGVGLTDKFQMGLRFPYLLDQSSELRGADAPDTSGIGDLRVEGKYRFRGGADQLGVALVPYVTLESGQDTAYFGKDSNAFGLALILDRNWQEKTYLVFQIGCQRQEKEVVPDFTVENTLLFGAGLGWRLANGKTRVAVEVQGKADGSSWLDKEEATPVEGIVSVSQAISQKTTACLGAGVGLTQGYGTPDYRVFAGVRALF